MVYSNYMLKILNLITTKILKSLFKHLMNSHNSLFRWKLNKNK